MNATLTVRTDADRARDMIESALTEYHTCGDCGAPMGISEHGTDLWVECSTLRERSGIRLLLSEAFHERHELPLSVSELAFAA